MPNPLTALTSVTAGLLDPLGRFAVLESCSGINSLKAMLALALILAYIHRVPLQGWAALGLAALLLSVLFNQLRVAALILLGDLPADAWRVAHTIIGYIAVMPTIYILIKLSERFAKK